MGKGKKKKEKEGTKKRRTGKEQEGAKKKEERKEERSKEEGEEKKEGKEEEAKKLGLGFNSNSKFGNWEFGFGLTQQVESYKLKSEFRFLQSRFDFGPILDLHSAITRLLLRRRR